MPDEYISATTFVLDTWAGIVFLSLTFSTDARYMSLWIFM